MDDHRINPIQFGQLLQSVENLVDDMSELKKDVATLTEEVATLNNLKNTGRGILLGALVGGGGLGALIAKWLEHFK